MIFFRKKKKEEQAPAKEEKKKENPKLLEQIGHEMVLTAEGWKRKIEKVKKKSTSSD
jgi:hypothetical protein